MLNEKKEEKSNINPNIIKGSLIIIVLFLMMVFIVFYKNDNSNGKKNNKINLEDMKVLFDKVKNNYTLNITERINDRTMKIKYSTDGNIELFEGDIFNEDGYLRYNNNVYLADLNTFKLTRVDNIDVLNDNFYNINFIKELISKCKYEYVSNTKTICKVNNNDYLNSYNSYFDTNYSSSVEETVDFEFIHSFSAISKINVDYTSLNKIINNSNDNLYYSISIGNIDNNNYDAIFEHYKDVLQK